MRYASIDIGSNAVRLLIADIVEGIDGTIHFRKDTLLRVPLRLGDDAFIKKHISVDKVQKMIQTMHSFKLLMDVYDVRDYYACATSAMREADNGADIVKACSEVGVDINIIDGAKEAEIIYNCQLESYVNNKRSYLYIDVGGGSTEISLFHNSELIESKSFNLGTIRILDNQDSPEVWKEMKRWVKEHTAPFKNVYGIGTGGNINKLSRLINTKEDKPFSLDKLSAVYKYLNSYSMRERVQILGLKQDRADVIIPATEIFLTIMKVGSLKNILAPRVGLVDGIIQTLINKNFDQNSIKTLV